MNSFNFFAKIVIPLAAATIAGASIFFSIRMEGKKIRMQRTHEFDFNSKLIIVRTIYCESLVKLLILSQELNKNISTTRLLDFKNKAQKLLDDIFTNTEIAFALKNEFEDLDKCNMFLLLAECRARCVDLEPDKRNKFDLIYFTLLTLIYLFEINKARRDIVYEKMKELKNGNPELANFLVSPRDRPLKLEAI